MQLCYNIHSACNVCDVFNSQPELMTVVAAVSLCSSTEQLCIWKWLTFPYNKPSTVPANTQKVCLQAFMAGIVQVILQGSAEWHRLFGWTFSNHLQVCSTAFQVYVAIHSTLKMEVSCFSETTYLRLQNWKSYVLSMSGCNYLNNEHGCTSFTETLVST
jgi:hypothetical protein